MHRRIKDVGGSIVGIAVMIAFFFLIIVLIKGATFVSAWAFPFLQTVSGFTLFIGVPLLLILGFIRPTRHIGGSGLYIASVVFGITVWISALLYTLSTWGWLAVFVGLVFAGVGIVPVAMVAAGFRQEWAIIGQLLLGVVAVFGCRAVGVIFLAKVRNSEDVPLITL